MDYTTLDVGDRYQLLGLLGHGGFGDVYRAHDRDTGAVVAIKHLRQVKPERLQQFKGEFRLLADLAHENLVQYHELLQHDGQWLLTMEFVRGHSFRDHVIGLDPIPGARHTSQDTATKVMDESSLEAVATGVAPLRPWVDAEHIERLRRTLPQLVAGLRQLHRAGIVHRDIKPGNVLVAVDGRVVIVDFGLAWRDEGEGFGPRPAGTIAYMAPEQLRGEQVTPAADFYAVGAMIYELLTGQIPFEGDVLMNLVVQIVRGEAVPVRKLRPEVDADLEGIVARAMARKIEDRYDSAAAAYRAAVAEGAELVVGPLTKTAVADVLGQAALPVPVLALNRAEGTAPAAGLQFALAPEDEAREIARRALGAGHRRALLLRPAGDWGDKVAAALRAAWTGGGGTLAATATFASRETHSDAIEQALHLDRSAARGAALRRLLDRGTVLAGRRREDIDVVFMLAPGTDAAKSLKPLLDYHYAGGLPVYATSAANSAEVSGGDRDLAGLRLVELPWLLGEQPALRAAVATAGLRGASLSRLQALGADAHRLALSHGALEPGGALVVHGATGRLTVNLRGEIERSLPLATFDSGGLRAD